MDLILNQSGDLLNSNLPNILGMVGTALLTVLIPMAIAIFSDTEDFEDLDRNVILDQIVQARCFLFYLALVYVPILVWPILVWEVALYTYTLPILRLFGLVVWVIGIACIVHVLQKAYRWMKGDKFQLRFDYLKKLRHPKDSEESWISVWKTENINAENEAAFFTPFAKAIDKDIKNDDRGKRLETTSKLLADFAAFAGNRSSVFLARELLPRCLEWHFSTWKRNYQSPHTRKRTYHDSTLSDALDSILRKAAESALKGGHSDFFFDHFKCHVEKYKEEHADDGAGNEWWYWYVDSVIRLFFKTLTENIQQSPERDDIRYSYFPSGWKITTENIQQEKNVVPLRLLNLFLPWVQERIRSAMDKKKYDAVMDEVMSILFLFVKPVSVEPELWAEILTFTAGDTLESLIVRGANFGHKIVIGAKAFKYPQEQQKERDRRRKLRESQEKETLELALRLFKFTKEKLDSFISELDALKKYDKDSREERRRKRFILIFEKMQKMIALREAEKPS